MNLALPTTEGTLLGGRVRYIQPATGFRSGIEPVLLAAAVPARAGERVLEAGSGAGAGLLCLHARVGRIMGMGVEIDPAITALARANVVANGHAGTEFMTADIVAIANLGPFDHAFANPPYHPASSTPSPSTPRAGAKIAAPGLLAAWIGAMSRAVRVRGSLSLIVPAGVVPECLAAIASTGCGSCCLMPLWPRAGRPAKLVILQAVRGGRGAFQLAPGMVLHEGSGFSAAADYILRDAGSLRLRGAG